MMEFSILGKHSPGDSEYLFVLSMAVTLSVHTCPKVCSQTSYRRRESSMALVPKVKLESFYYSSEGKPARDCLITSFLPGSPFFLIWISPPGGETEGQSVAPAVLLTHRDLVQSLNPCSLFYHLYSGEINSITNFLKGILLEKNQWLFKEFKNCTNILIKLSLVLYFYPYNNY